MDTKQQYAYHIQGRSQSMCANVVGPSGSTHVATEPKKRVSASKQTFLWLIVPKLNVPHLPGVSQGMCAIF